MPGVIMILLSWKKVMQFSRRHIFLLSSKSVSLLEAVARLHALLDEAAP